MTTSNATIGRHLGRRTFIKTGAALGIALSIGGFSGSALAEEHPTEPVASGWHDMELDAVAKKFSLLWTAPETAEPDGLIGGVFLRARSLPDALGAQQTLVQLNTGFGLDPNAREFLFRQSAANPATGRIERLRGGLVIEGDQLGVAFGGSNLANGVIYTLTVTDEHGNDVLAEQLRPGETSFSFTASGGRGSRDHGPATTSFAENLTVANPINIEDTFTYAVSSSDGRYDPNVHRSGPSDTEEEAAEPFDPFPHPDPVTGYTLSVIEPEVELIGGEPEIELIASSLAKGPEVYPFVVEVRNSSNQVVTDVDVEWQMIVDGQVQTPGERPPAEQPPAEDPPAQPALKTLTITGTGARAYYMLRVSSKDVGKSTANGASINGNDHVLAAKNGAVGTVITGADSFTFSGEVLSFHALGNLTARLSDGTNTTPVTPTASSTVVTFGGTGPRAFYGFSALGWVFKSTANGASINRNDVVSGPGAGGVTSVSGTVVRSGRDSYVVVGELLTLRADDSVALLKDGAAATAETLLPHTITVVGDGTWASYAFSTSGTVVKSTANGASINAHDVISGQNVSGRVRGGIDSYRFGGDVSNLVVNGTVSSITVDGRSVAA